MYIYYMWDQLPALLAACWMSPRHHWLFSIVLHRSLIAIGSASMPCLTGEDLVDRVDLGLLCGSAYISLSSPSRGASVVYAGHTLSLLQLPLRNHANRQYVKLDTCSNPVTHILPFSMTVQAFVSPRAGWFLWLALPLCSALLVATNNRLV